jgi:hypothetical protein
MTGPLPSRRQPFCQPLIEADTAHRLADVERLLVSLVPCRVAQTILNEVKDEEEIK